MPYLRWAAAFITLQIKNDMNFKKMIAGLLSLSFCILLHAQAADPDAETQRKLRNG